MPLLVPGLPKEMVTQVALLVAVREQGAVPLTRVMLIVSLPPAAAKLVLVGFRVKTQFWAKAAPVRRQKRAA